MTDCDMVVIKPGSPQISLLDNKTALPWIGPPQRNPRVLAMGATGVYTNSPRWPLIGTTTTEHP
eukprot:9959301-Lingulodinium_polyedra.AAC.1